MDDREHWLQTNSLDGGFLQSDFWRDFQAATGHSALSVVGEGFSGIGLTHMLPFVGSYLYFPRGPLAEPLSFSLLAQALREAGEKKEAKWLRIEPQTEAMFATLKQAFGKRIMKAPHDMQPRETFVLDIRQDSEVLLAAMKPKTRYNIRLAEKRGVRIFATKEKRYQEAFLDLVAATARRKEIAPHPRSYYEKFFTAMPDSICQLFVAEYGGKVLAANLVIFFGKWGYYLHGGTGNEHRDMMAPFLLQWQQILSAKERGCEFFDLGGVRMAKDASRERSWEGITRFKVGFAPETFPRTFPGTYDIILDRQAYVRYKYLRLLRQAVVNIKQFLIG